MQRLTRRLRRDERGAAAVVLSLLMVPLLGFTALAVDAGAVYAEKARLQTAADAAALAVAQDCARGNCGDMLATATVAWGTPGAGTAELPLTFSWCEFSAQTGGGLPSGTTVRTIKFTKTSETGCTGPSHNVVPGGFAYLDTNPGHCEATSARGGKSYSSTGNSVPSPCSAADFSALIGHTVLLPLFDDFGSTGNNAWYHVYGYAAFKLTGFFLGGQFRTSPQPCSGNERCVAGYFTRFVDLSERFTYTNDGPDLGAAILRLVR
jgi:hypothetical protein